MAKKTRNLHCFGTRILVRKEPLDDKYGGEDGLIYKPEEVKDRTFVGTVIDGGPETIWVNKGDVVMFSRHSGVEVYGVDGYEDCKIMNEEDLLGILVEAK